MNEMKLTPTELMHKLDSAKQSLKKQRSAYHGEIFLNLRGNPIVVNKPKCKCFKCGHKGHWKNDCPKLGMANLNVVKACIVDNYYNKWIIDSRATNHVCNSLQ